MKHLLDIHTVLSTEQDMLDMHDDPYQASEKLNTVLHMVYDRADEDIELESLENMIADTWEYWHKHTYLVDIEVDDLLDWVDHLVNNWNNADSQGDITH